MARRKQGPPPSVAGQCVRFVSPGLYDRRKLEGRFFFVDHLKSQSGDSKIARLGAPDGTMLPGYFPANGLEVTRFSVRRQ